MTSTPATGDLPGALAKLLEEKARERELRLDIAHKILSIILQESAENQKRMIQELLGEHGSAD